MKQTQDRVLSASLGVSNATAGLPPTLPIRLRLLEIVLAP
jgi:hypothetical protein